MNPPEPRHLLSLLHELEAALVAAQLWQDQPPSKQALVSTEPFCIDTLAFEQWLQFVMLPNFHFILEKQLPLPKSCQISPMASLVLQDVQILSILRKIDDLFENGH